MDSTEAQKKETLTDDQLKDWLQVGDSWVEKNFRARRIPGQFKAGKERRYMRAEIERQIITTGQVLLPKQKVANLGLRRRR